MPLVVLLEHFCAYYGKTNLPNNILKIDKKILVNLDIIFNK